MPYLRAGGRVVLSLWTKIDLVRKLIDTDVRDRHTVLVGGAMRWDGRESENDKAKVTGRIV